jgi:LacI family transcriptional regulator
MAHDFLIKDIAFQAGLSTATVDRVINDRSGVRRQTRARVEAAIAELSQQESAAALTGRTYVFDIIMETPDRFSTAARAAFESEAVAFLPAVLRSRFHFAEQMREHDLLALVARIRRRGSHGVVLKAADTPAITQAVADLHEAKIPVITLVTDLPHSQRIAYAGADNHAAGETAGYLIGTRLQSGTVLAVLSSSRFYGEEERLTGLRGLLKTRWPHLKIIDIGEGFGKEEATGRQVRAALASDRTINAVYSIGGGNRAIIEAFADLFRSISCFVAHDLDQDNLDLLKQGKLDYVLHHNLNNDAASVFRAFLKAHHAIPRMAGPVLSAVEIITPFNMPASFSSSA